MIVIDIGCAAYGGDESIPYLIEEFHPHVVLGFDPAVEFSVYELGGTMVIEAPLAAWSYTGTLGFEVAGLRGHVDPRGLKVRCFDLARLILGLTHSGAEVVLKMDAEGAEGMLLEWLRDHGADLALKLAWVEYHCPDCGRGGGSEISHVETCKADPAEVAAGADALEGRMRCEMHRWNR